MLRPIRGGSLGSSNDLIEFIDVTPPGQTAPSWTASGRRHGTKDRNGKDEMDA